MATVHVSLANNYIFSVNYTPKLLQVEMEIRNSKNLSMQYSYIP